MKQLPLMEEVASPPPALSDAANLMNELIPSDAVEVLLEQFLYKELAEFEMLNIKALPESSIVAKWKMSSALQKSIRRGYVEDSIQYALTYHALDPVGFWNRIVIICLEDTGVADPWAVAMTLAAARSSVWRKKAGGDEKVIRFIIKNLAEAINDRTVADFCQVIENRSLSPEALTLLKSATPQELSTIALSDRPYEVRIAALWMLWGDRMQNPRLPLGEGSREWFDYTIENMKVPGLVKYITLRGMVACRGCAMNISYVFIWEMLQKSPYRRVIETELPERFYIGGIPEEAWDKHTRQGKAAYLYFYKACSIVSDFLTSRGIVGNDDIIRAIGIAMFINESAILGRKVDFEGAAEVYMMTVKDDYRKNGLTLADGIELSRLIQENHAVLRRSRQVVVDGNRR
jgi:hypothetical protein